MKADDNTSFKRDVEYDCRDEVICSYKLNTLNLNKELHRKCDKIKHEIQIKNNKKNQIEHYFNAVERQLQYTMKKIM